MFLKKFIFILTVLVPLTGLFSQIRQTVGEPADTLYQENVRVGTSLLVDNLAEFSSDLTVVGDIRANSFTGTIVLEDSSITGDNLATVVWDEIKTIASDSARAVVSDSARLDDLSDNTTDELAEGTTNKYVTLDNLKDAVSNDFHNLGGTDANTTYTADGTTLSLTGTTFEVADDGIGYTQIDTGATGWVDVRKFGAVGDGVTDDTDAIQAAIDYVYSLGGGTVFFPNGTYLVSKKKTYSCLTTYQAIRLVGTGPRNSGAYALTGSSCIKMDANQNTCIVVNEDYEKLMNGVSPDYWHFGTIENLLLDANGNNNATTAECIKIHRAGEVSAIRNVHCAAFRDTAIVIHTSTPAILENVSCFPASGAGATERIAIKATGRTTRIIAPSGDNCTPFFYLSGSGSITIISPKLEFSASYGDPALYIEDRAGAILSVNISGGSFWKSPITLRGGDMISIHSDSIYAGNVQLRGVNFAGFENIIKQTAWGVSDSLYRTNTTDYFIDDIVWGTGYKATYGDVTIRDGLITKTASETNTGGFYTDRLYTPFLRIGEKQNYILQSQTFGTTWYKEGSGALTVADNVEIAPDGTLTADELDNTAVSAKGILQNITDLPSFAQGQKYTFSVWLKGAGTAIGSTIPISLFEIGGGGSQSGNSTTATLTSQWELYIVRLQIIETNRTTIQAKITVPASTDSVYVWGAQLNAGYQLYPYTPTTTASVTSGSAMVGGNASFANITTNDSMRIGSAGDAWMRKAYQATNDVGFVYYNNNLGRVDTVYAFQEAATAQQITDSLDAITWSGDLTGTGTSPTLAANSVAEAEINWGGVDSDSLTEAIRDAQIYQSQTFTFLQPDSIREVVTDSLVFFCFDDLAFPNGAKLGKVRITTSAAVTDTIAIYEYSTRAGASIAVIDSFFFSSQQDAESLAVDLDDSDMAADSWLCLDLSMWDATCKTLEVTIVYYIKPGD